MRTPTRLMPHQRYEIDVIGTPAPQGSKRHVGKGVMIESSKKVKPWREAVSSAAWAARGAQEPLDGPLYLHVDFYLPRPASAARRLRTPWKRPDIDKLLRSTFDGITESGLWVDDARVVEVTARKVFVGDWHLGAAIRVGTIEGWADEMGIAG